MSNEKTLTEFYDVKNKGKITVPMDRVKKIRFKRQGPSGRERISYALRGEWDGRNFTKFINKQLWESLDIPSEKDRLSGTAYKSTSSKKKLAVIRSSGGQALKYQSL